MEERTNIPTDTGNVFSALFNLQSETYELIVRSLAMDEWLKRAYSVIQEKPEWNAERTYESWRHSFGHVYTNLFAMFFRPHRLMMFPFNPFSGQRLETITSKPPENIYLDMFTMWGEAQSRLLKGMAHAIESYSGGDGKFPAEDSILDPESTGLRPIGLMKNIVDEQSKTYIETFDVFMQYFGETQFLLPKSFFTYLQELLSSYPKAYQVGERYESMLRNTWDESLKRLAVEVRKSPERKIEYKDFFDSYITIFGEEYDRLLRSPEYTELQANLSSMVSTTISASQKMMDAQLEMFPALPFAPRADVDALAQRVHSVKRRLNTLERNVRQMERTNPPQGDILESLAKRVAEMEDKLRRLPVETELEGLEKTDMPHAHPRAKERE